MQFSGEEADEHKRDVEIGKEGHSMIVPCQNLLLMTAHLAPAHSYDSSSTERGASTCFNQNVNLDVPSSSLQIHLQ